MTTKADLCINIKYGIDLEGKLEAVCQKHYCSCEDKFLWDNELDKGYQKEKSQGRAYTGKFFTK